MKRRSFILAAGGILWLLVVAMGMKALWDYAQAPGTAATPPAYWPGESKIPPGADRAMLIMFAHPHCPCSRASIRELELVIARLQGRLSAYVLFYKPADSDDWEATDLYQSAKDIPGVEVLIDENGAEAHRFNVTTSGQVILYDVYGRLMFSGGITSSRGHSGDNAGRSAIVSLLTEGSAGQSESPVFGCSIFEDTSECHKGVE